MGSAVCVKECPGSTAKAVNCPLAANGGKNLSDVCTNGVSNEATYKTYTFVKYCIPSEGKSTAIKGIWDDMLRTLNGSGPGQYLFDVLNASSPISLCLITGFVYCLLFIFILSMFAEVFCWLCIILVQLGLIVLPCILGYEYMNIKKNFGPEGICHGVSDNNDCQALDSKATLFICGAIALGCLCACFSGCLYCSYHHLKHAIDVIDASTKFVLVTKRIMLVPLVYFMMSMAVVIVWFVGYLMVMSINPISASTLIPQVRTVDWSTETMVYAFIMWFGLLWSLIVIDYAKNFIVIFSASTYYFNSPLCELDE